MKKQTVQNLLIGCVILLLAVVFQLWPRPQPNLVTVTDSYSPRLEPSCPDVSVQLVQDSNDTVRNPYAPPLRYDENTYTQLGYLAKGSTKLILFGKPASRPRRDKWYYYTMVNNIKLPVEVNKRKCTVSPGCDSLSDKDRVMVDGEEYVVTLYETDLLYF
jgi:hypothetical protein